MELPIELNKIINSSTYAPLLTKTTERIDWSLTANKLHNLVRGLDPWPGSYCDF